MKETARSTMLSRICIIFFLTFSRLQAGDLYSIMLCDTYAHNISDSIELDLTNMRKEVSRIQLYTELRLIEVNFNGSDLIPAEIFTFLSGLQFNPDDVVILFFSGHGYRTPSKGDNPWPNLYCSVANQGIDFLYITEMLKNKNPGLLFTMCDCCNNSLPDNAAPDVVQKDLISASMDKQMRKNYIKLFLETTGVIMIRSSEVGEYSWCNSKGAIFTSSFLESLQNSVRNSKHVTWESILDNAGKKVWKHQTPVYQLMIQTQ